MDSKNLKKTFLFLSVSTILVVVFSLLFFPSLQLTYSQASTYTFVKTAPLTSKEQTSTLEMTTTLLSHSTDSLPHTKLDCVNLSTGKGSSSKGASNLCSIFNGRVQSDSCNYYHPNIVHFVHFKTSNSSFANNIGFREYLSILSVHKFFKPDKMVIHCNNNTFTGPYWEKASKLSTPIELRKTERITSISKKNTKPTLITHEADYLKISTALKEGGIYMDFDAVILNGTRLREMQRKSECVLGRDDERCTRTCAGFFSSVPGSTFVQKWLQTYENDYRPKNWYHNAGTAPSKLLRDCPSCYDVFVDGQMSNWLEAQQNRWMTPGKVDWKLKSVAHYMNSGFMSPLKKPEELVKIDAPFTNMVKYVLGDMVAEYQ